MSDQTLRAVDTRYVDDIPTGLPHPSALARHARRCASYVNRLAKLLQPRLGGWSFVENGTLVHSDTPPEEKVRGMVGAIIYLFEGPSLFPDIATSFAVCEGVQAAYRAVSKMPVQWGNYWYASGHEAAWQTACNAYLDLSTLVGDAPSLVLEADDIAVDERCLTPEALRDFAKDYEIADIHYSQAMAAINVEEAAAMDRGLRIIQQHGGQMLSDRRTVVGWTFARDESKSVLTDRPRPNYAEEVAAADTFLAGIGDFISFLDEASDSRDGDVLWAPLEQAGVVVAAAAKRYGIGVDLLTEMLQSVRQVGVRVGEFMSSVGESDSWESRLKDAKALHLHNLKLEVLAVRFQVMREAAEHQQLAPTIPAPDAVTGNGPLPKLNATDKAAAAYIRAHPGCTGLEIAGAIKKNFEHVRRILQKLKLHGYYNPRNGDGYFPPPM